MTKLRLEKVRCAACGQRSEQPVLSSTNASGASDLDTRPPEMLRSTLPQWVQQCPHCGCCAKDLPEAPESASWIVRDPGYQKQLVDPAFPALANRFLCVSCIAKVDRDPVAATWAVIHAAWACDDEGTTVSEVAAMICRSLAAEMLGDLDQSDLRLVEPEGADLVLRVELLRRADQAVEARALSASARARVRDASLRRLLEYEDALIGRGDIARHTIADAGAG